MQRINLTNKEVIICPKCHGTYCTIIKHSAISYLAGADESSATVKCLDCNRTFPVIVCHPQPKKAKL